MIWVVQETWPMLSTGSVYDKRREEGMTGSGEDRSGAGYLFSKYRTSTTNNLPI